MKRRIVAALALILGVALVSPLAEAHELFLKLDSYFLPPDAPVRVSLLNGTFEASESSVAADRVDEVSIIRGGRRRIIGTDGWDAQGDTTFLELQTGEAGTYVVSVSTLPRELDLTAAEFNEYLAHDGIPDVLEARTAAGELQAGVRERYSKHVKAVYQVGDERSAGLDRILGYPAELIPVTNPYELSPGGMMSVRALVDALPVEGQLVFLGGTGEEGPFPERSARSDPNGLVRFRIGEPGRWYVRFIHMVKAPDDDVDYESKWTTLTFEVR